MFLRITEDEEEQKIVVNSFYDVFPEKLSKEELLEYKKLVGMPLAETYEELIESLK